jgi:uncharacterized protein YqkB
MNIVPTQEALVALQSMLPINERTIKIAYDTEGCGCAVNGVVQLWHIGRMQPEDAIGFDKGVRIVYDRRQELFFEDHIMLDYNSSHRSFILMSNSQIYHSSLTLINKLEVHAHVDKAIRNY